MAGSYLRFEPASGSHRVVRHLRHVKDLRACCIGSRAALASFLLDRESLTDEELRKIIARLDEVIHGNE